MTADKPKAGSKVDEMSFPIVGSRELVSIGQTKDRWTMLFVYRGKHCPRCKRFLNKLNAVLPCLLYTSPSPRDKRQSRMPSSA